MSPTSAGVSVNPTSGVLSGKAYANVGSWINFSPMYSGTGPQVGVSLVDNGSGSDFQGWAWVSGAHGGWMKFDCAGTGLCVKTDWRAIPYRTTYQCSDGIDNDSDGVIDFPADPGCSSLTDNDELSSSGGVGGGGSGGGGGGSACVAPLVYSNGYCINPVIVSTPQQPINPNNQCGPYLLKYIKLGAKNDPVEVRKLQRFLIDHEQEKLKIDGKYKLTDYQAVKRFQEKYSGEVLGPWGSIKPTGYVYKTTVAKINSFMCPTYSEKVIIEKPVATKTCPIFTKKHRVGSIGGDIEKIRIFLNTQFPELKLKKTFIYNRAMSNAVKLYQQKYYSDIIIPAQLPGVTGIWADFSMKQANKIEGCPS
jgi:peptidoglycan hydrolase-like protein with peptidoglycan-binding domain